MEQGIRFGVLLTGLLSSATRLDERVEPLRLDPLVGVRILVGHGRLDGLREVADRLSEAHGVFAAVTLTIPLG